MYSASPERFTMFICFQFVQVDPTLFQTVDLMGLTEAGPCIERIPTFNTGDKKFSVTKENTATV